MKPFWIHRQTHFATSPYYLDMPDAFVNEGALTYRRSSLGRSTVSSQSSHTMALRSNSGTAPPPAACCCWACSSSSSLCGRPCLA